VVAVPQAAVTLEPGVPWEVPVREAWPTEAWPQATPEEVGLDPQALQRLVDYGFRRDGDEVDRKGQRTNALLIVKDGKLVVERYARGYTGDTPMLTWSVSKSMSSTIFGAAVMDGLVDVNQTACHYYEPMCRPGHDAVRVTDLLRMSSGIQWDETYETSPIFSSVMAMLYTRGSHDMPAFVARQPMAFWPGIHWSYSSGDANVGMAVLRGAIGNADRYHAYPWERVFDPIGMKDVTFERDGSGTFVGSSYLYARPPDLARWLWLILNDGTWDGRRILAPGWVRYLRTMAPAYYTTPVSRASREDNPGAWWYVNLGDPERDIAPPWPDFPSDAFGAEGHWGKYLWVIPSWDMVVVRLGDDREYGCAYAWQTDCVKDPNKAFTITLFQKLLAQAVK